MPTVNEVLEPGKVLTVTAGSTGGTLSRLPDTPGAGAQSDSVTVPASCIAQKGPFATQTTWQFPSTFTHSASDVAPLGATGGEVDFGTDVPDTKSVVRYFDDFFQKLLDETNENWILNSGTDAAAVDPAVVVAEGGTIFLDCGAGDGSVAADGSQIVWAIPVQADSGGLYFEARVKIEDISECSVNVGLTDATGLEEPFSIATATLTSVATDAVCFTFDDGATLKQWHMSGVDGDTEATGNGALGADYAPTDDTYQVLRCEIDADGEGATFFINGVQVGQLTAAVCDASTNLYFTAIIVGDGSNAAAAGLTVDYVDIGHNR